MPLYFEPNVGQTGSAVDFISRGRGYGLFLTANEALLAVGGGQPGAAVSMKLEGANTSPKVSGVDPLPGRTNYFIGNDPAKWRTDVPTYGKVKYEGVYPGVDLLYYGNQQQLEYDFVVAPGADPGAIRLRIHGAERMEISAAGDLVLNTGAGRVEYRKPVVYQPDERGDGRKTVDGRFVLEDKDEVAFDVAEYDHTKSLVIDPAVLFSTLLGGGAADGGYNISLDPLGNIYVTGGTTSAAPAPFPTTVGADQTVFGGGPASCGDPLQSSCGDIFVTKLDPTGSTLMYSTYIGGSDRESGLGFAVDGSGNAYISGETRSTNFPVTATALSGTFPATATRQGFFTELNAAGSGLIYSTFLGGSLNTIANLLTLDTNGFVYVVGATSATNFPVTAGAFQPTCNNCAVAPDGFVVKLDPTKSGAASEVYGTYLGGSGPDDIFGVAVDASGNAYVTGNTASADFPTLNPIQPAFGGGGTTCPANHVSVCGDAFITKLNPTGTALVYSTYLGGSGEERGVAIAVDAAGNAYVTGGTDSANFPTTAGALQTTYGGGSTNPASGLPSCVTAGLACGDGFLTEINAAGTAFVFSTFIGGSGDDLAIGLSLDKVGDIYVTGVTNSSNFPVTANAFQPVFGGGTSQANCVPGLFCGDGFLTVLGPGGTTALFTTYSGASGDDAGTGIVVDSFGNVYATGVTGPPGIPPTTTATYAGGFSDAFVAKFTVFSPSACTANWTGASIGDWNTPTSWSTNPSLPGPLDNVCQNGANLTVSGTLPTGFQSIASLNTSIPSTPGATGSLTVMGGSLTIANVASVTSTLNNFTLNGGTLLTGSSVSINGTATISSGTLIAGASVSTNSTTTISGGTVTLKATGSVSFNGLNPFTWSGGTINGAPGAIAALNASTISITGNPTLDTVTANAESNVTMSGGVGTTLTVSGGGQIVNFASWDMGDTSGISQGTGAVGTFNNNVSFVKKTGPGTTTVSIQFLNSGTVNANNGTLALTGPGSGGNGIYNVATNLVFGGTQTLTGGHSIAGAGNINWAAAAASMIFGTYNVTGTTTFGGGTLNFGTGENVTLGPTTENSGAVTFGSGSTFAPMALANTLTVNGGSMTFSTAQTGGVSLSTLTFNGGTLLNNVDAIAITGALNWTAGTFQGAAGVTATGGTTLSGSGTGILAGGETFHSNSTFTQSGTASLDLEGGAIFQQGPGVTFNLDSNSGINSGTTGTFIIAASPTAATLAINVATSVPPTTHINVPVLSGSAGNLTVTGGELDLNAGATFCASLPCLALISVASNTTLKFVGGTDTMGAGHTISGAGTIFWEAVTAATLTGGIYNITGATKVDFSTVNFNAGEVVQNLGATSTTGLSALTFNSGVAINSPVNLTVNTSGSLFTTFSTGQPGGVTFSNLNMTLGFLGGTDNFTVTGPLLWTGGNIMGATTTSITANGGITMNGSTATLDGRAMTNANNGTATLIGSPNLLLMKNGAVFNNPAGSLFDIQADNNGGPRFGGGANVTFNNAGTLQKSTSSGQAVVSPNTFNNTGTVKVLAGTLVFFGNNSTGNGSYTVTSPATLQFEDVTDNIGGPVSGNGSVIFSSTANVTGAYTVSGTTTVDLTGSPNFTGTVTGVGPFVFSGGTSTFSTGQIGGIPLAAVNFSGGIVNGNDRLNIAGALNWAGGAFNGPGVVNASGGVALPGPGCGVVSGTVFNAKSDVTQSSAGVNTGCLALQSGAIWNQSVATTYNLNNVAGISGSSNEIFNNRGTFQKAGTLGGAAPIGVSFNNFGTLSLTVQELDFKAGGLSSGSISLGANTILSFNGGTFNVSGPITTTGALANVNALGGTLNFAAGASASGVNALFVGNTTNIASGVNLGIATVTVITGGVLNGAGMITGSLAMGAGTIHPGASGSPGILTVSGSYMETGGTLSLTVNGNTNSPVVQYSQLQVIGAPGTAAVGSVIMGTLGYAAMPGDVLMPVTAVGGVSGTFAAPNSLAAPAGDTWNLTYTNPAPGNVTATLAAPSACNTWTGPVSGGNYNTAADWSASRVPIATDDVCITGANNVSVLTPLAAANQTIKSLTVSATAALGVSNGPLSVSGMGSIGNLVVGTGGTITFNGSTTFSGALSVNGGTLNFAGPATTSVALFFAGGTTTFNSGSSLGGTGAVMVSGGTVNFNSGSTYTVTGATQVSSGKANWGGTITNPGTFTISGGVVGFSPAAGSALNALTFSGGTLNILSTTNVGGLFTWSGGTLFTSGSFSPLAANGGISIPAGSNLTFQSGQLNNAATATMLGPAASTITWPSSSIGNATILNLSGATWDVQDDSSFNVTSNAIFGASFNNKGTYKKSAGAGATNIQWDFDNNGAVQVASGTLSLLGGGGSSCGGLTFTCAGSWNAGSGATITYGSFIPGPAFLGYNMSGMFSGTGTFQATSLADFVLKPGASTAAGSTLALNVNGGIVELGGGSFNFSGGVNIFAGILAGSGTITGNLNNSGGTVFLCPSGLCPVSIPPFPPVSGAGLLTINGNYTQGAGGTFTAGIGGLTVGTGGSGVYSQLMIGGGGSATLNGTLAGGLVGGFTPVTGNMFTLVNVASPGTITGAFSGNALTAPAGSSWTVTTNTPPGTVIASFVGPPPGMLSVAAINGGTFGSVPVGSKGMTTVTATNSGGSPVTFAAANAFAISGPNMADFTISGNNCPVSPATLAASAMCNFTLTFAPAPAGISEMATLTITDNASNNPQTLALSGTGLSPVVTTSAPNGVNFGSVTQGLPSAAMPVMINVTAGTGTLIAPVITVVSSGAGSIPADFAISMNTCGATVAPGASCSVTLTFTPSQANMTAESANLSIAGNQAGSPTIVPLSGIGLTPTTSFTFTPAPGTGTQVSIIPGQTAQFTIMLNPSASSSGTVNFSCASTPATPTIICSVKASTNTLTGATQITLVITFQTNCLGALPPRGPMDMPPAMPPHVVVLWMLSLLGLAAARRFAPETRLARVAPAVMMLMLTMSWAGCASSSSVNIQGQPKTPPGLYTLDIAATSGVVVQHIQLMVRVN